jgi:hypothetical protein
MPVASEIRLVVARHRSDRHELVGVLERPRPEVADHATRASALVAFPGETAEKCRRLVASADLERVTRNANQIVARAEPSDVERPLHNV